MQVQIFHCVLFELEAPKAVNNGVFRRSYCCYGNGNLLCSSRKDQFLPCGREYPSPAPLEILIELYTFLKIFGSYGILYPQEISIPSVGGVWILSGTEKCVTEMITTCSPNMIGQFFLIP